MQHAKGYAGCERFDVKYVFATSGHCYTRTPQQTIGQFEEQERVVADALGRLNALMAPAT